MKLITNKRGVSESQFHWIFVLIAGGFLLFLLVSFSLQGLEASKKRHTVTVLRELESALTNTKTLGDINRKLEADKSLTVSITCDIDNSAFSQIQVESIPRDTYSLAIFSKGSLQGDYYIARALTYEVPFKVDTALYLTDSRTLYVLVSDDETFLSEMNSLLPAYATVVNTSSLNSLTNTGFDTVIIVGDNIGQVVTSQLNPKFAKQEIYVTDIVSDSLMQTGSVYFQRKQRVFLSSQDREFLDDGSAEYVGKAELLGAVMSGTLDTYNCQKSKLEKRLQMSAAFYGERARLLSTDYESEYTQVTTQACRASYTSAADYFSDIVTSSSITQEQITRLSQLNQQIITRSCPEIY